MSYYFVSSGNYFSIEKYIASQSPILEKKIDNNEHDIYEISPEIFKKVLNYLETGTLELNPTHASIFSKLVQASIDLQLRDLEELLYSEIEQVVNVDNLPTLIASLKKFGHVRTKTYVYQYFNEKKEEIDQKIINKLDAKTVLEIWKNSQKLKPLPPIPKEKSQREQHFLKLYKTKKYADAEIVSASGKTVAVHKGLLCKEKYFSILFARTSSINLQLSDTQLEALVKFLYIQKLETSLYIKDYLELLEFSSKSGLVKLHDAITARLSELVNPENALDIMHCLYKIDEVEENLLNVCNESIKNIDLVNPVNQLLKELYTEKSQITLLQEKVRMLEKKNADLESLLKKKKNGFCKMLWRKIKQLF